MIPHNSSFVILLVYFIFIIRLKHLFTNICSLLVIWLVVFQVSQAYNNTDFTVVLNIQYSYYADQENSILLNFISIFYTFQTRRFIFRKIFVTGTGTGMICVHMYGTAWHIMVWFCNSRSNPVGPVEDTVKN